MWTLAIVTVILAGGCAAPQSGDRATPGTPTPTGSQNVEFSTVTVSRTGGIAGFSDKYTVTPEGALIVESRRKPPAKKTLTPGELSQLKALVTSDALAAEARQGRLGARRCADGFVYTLASGEVKLSGLDCGDLGRQAPTLMKVYELVQTASHRA